MRFGWCVFLLTLASVSMQTQSIDGEELKLLRRLLIGRTEEKRRLEEQKNKAQTDDLWTRLLLESARSRKHLLERAEEEKRQLQEKRKRMGYIDSVLLGLLEKGGNSQLDEFEKRQTNPVIVIDLGTSFSRVAVYRQGKAEIIPNKQGNPATPSYVAFTESGILVGDAAKNQASTNPSNTVFDLKRLIGREFEDYALQDHMRQWPFTVVKENGRVKIQVNYQGVTKTFHPEQLEAMMISFLKESAEAFLGNSVIDVILTVSATFNDAQRRARKNAAAIAGLNVLRLVNEPTAAAIFFGEDQKIMDDRTVAVVDFGGGSFDVSILTIGSGFYEINAVYGDKYLGGRDIDNLMVSYFANNFQSEFSMDITKDKAAISKLTAACEQAKLQLSTQREASVTIDSLHAGINFQSSITRAKFESLVVGSLEDRMAGVMRNVVVHSGMSVGDIQDIVAVGGSTRIPLIQSLIDRYFNKAPRNDIDPEDTVALGAAMQAAAMSGSPEFADLFVMDVIPASIGIETTGGVNTILIPRDTSIPSKKKEILSTDSDNQAIISMKILEGERQISKDNHLLGKFDITGFQLAPRGVPRIEVTLDLDPSGILSVSAVDMLNKDNKYTVTEFTGNLNKDDVTLLAIEHQLYNV